MKTVGMHFYCNTLKRAEKFKKSNFDTDILNKLLWVANLWIMGFNIDRFILRFF